MGYASKCRGFTLMELVMVIVISSILAGMLAGFVSRPIEAYIALSSRAELVDQAELALRRMQRDIRRALPNSIRVEATGRVLEMVNVAEGVAYRDQPPPGMPSARLEFTAADDEFDILGHFHNLPLPVMASTAYRLAVYNLGLEDGIGNPLPGLNVYATLTAPGPFPPTGSHVITPAGTAVTLTAPGGDEDHVLLDNPHRFALSSPEQRLYIIDTPVTYLCDLGSGTLTRYWNYPLTPTQPATVAALTGLGASSARVANRLTSCTFTYQPGSPQRAAQAVIELAVEENGEQVRLLHQVHADNTP